MRILTSLFLVLATASVARGQVVTRDIPYASPAHERQVLDVHAPPGAKNLPVVFWIHGGGWQTGHKGQVALKPKAFNDAGLVFVSINHRLWPTVEMGDIFRDVAKGLRWVHDHVAEHGGDPTRVLVMGHSSGGQLAAIVCTDDRYLKAEGLVALDDQGVRPGGRRHVRHPGHHRSGRSPGAGARLPAADQRAPPEVRQRPGQASRLLGRHACRAQARASRRS